MNHGQIKFDLIIESISAIAKKVAEISLGIEMEFHVTVERWNRFS